MEDAIPTLELGSSAIPYSLRRSRRARRLRITVRPEGVEVVAPARASSRDVQDFVLRHADWVAGKVSALQRTLDAHPGPERRAAGGRILLRGRAVELRIAPGGARLAVSCRDGLEVRVPERLSEDEREAAIAAALPQWLRRAAREDAERLARPRPAPRARTRRDPDQGAETPSGAAAPPAAPSI